MSLSAGLDLRDRWLKAISYVWNTFWTMSSWLVHSSLEQNPKSSQCLSGSGFCIQVRSLIDLILPAAKEQETAFIDIRVYYHSALSHTIRKSLRFCFLVFFNSVTTTSEKLSSLSCYNVSKISQEFLMLKWKKKRHS